MRYSVLLGKLDKTCHRAVRTQGFDRVLRALDPDKRCPHHVERLSVVRPRG